MKIKITKSNNGIHSYVSVSAEDIDSEDLEFLTEIINTSSKYNENAIDKA